MPETRRKRGEYGSKFHILRCPYCNHVVDKNDEANNHVSIVYSFGFECLIDCTRCGNRFYFKAFKSGYNIGLLNKQGLIYETQRKREYRKSKDENPVNSPVMNKIRLMLSDSTEALNDINVLQFKYCIKLFKKWSLIEYYKIFQFLEYYKDVPNYVIEDTEAKARFTIQPDYRVYCEFKDCYVNGLHRNIRQTDIEFIVDFRYEYDRVAVCKYASDGTLTEMKGSFFRPEISYTFITLMKQLKSYKAFLLGQNLKPKEYLTNPLEDVVWNMQENDKATILQTKYALFKKTLQRLGLLKKIQVTPEIMNKTKKDVALYEKLTEKNSNKMLNDSEITDIFEKLMGVDLKLEKKSEESENIDNDKISG